MTLRSIICCFGLLALPGSVFGAEHSLYRFAVPGMLDEAVVFEGPWAEDRVQQRLEAFFQANRGRYAFYRLTIGTSDVATRYALHFGHEGTTFIETVKALNAGGFPSGPLAQLVGIGSSALIVERVGGKLIRKALGDNAEPDLFVTKSGRRYRLLHFHLHLPGPNVDALLKFFMEGENGVAVSDCADILATLTDLTKGTFLNVALRPDTWFFENDDYPILYPFTEPLRIPKEIEYSLAPYVTCYYTKLNGVSCTAQSALP